MVEAQQVRERAAALLAAKRALHVAIEAQVAATKTLEFSQAQRLVEGVEGKTVAEREARLLLDLQDEHEAVERAELTLRDARMHHELALIDFEALKLEMRLLELATGTPTGERDAL